MIALYVNSQPNLIDTHAKVEERVKQVLKDNPDAEISKSNTVTCGSCGSHYFDNFEAITCPCHDY